jgi:hypothetical protein
MFILLIFVYFKLWHCNGLEWHNIHAKLCENWASGLKSTFVEAIMSHLHQGIQTDLTENMPTDGVYN